MNLPELPEPADYFVHSGLYWRRVYKPYFDSTSDPKLAIYTADQMRAYALQAVEALTQALATTERKGEPFPGYVNLAGTLRRIQRSTYLSRDDQIALSHAADTLAALPLPTERKGEPEVMQDGGPPCKRDPRAPHGFLRNASHSAGRYVCECEFWEPPATPEPVQTERDQSRKGGSDNE